MSRPHRDGTKQKESDFVWIALSLGVAELLGTALLVFLGCMAGVPGLTKTPPTVLQHALAFGITVSIVVQVFGHISGAHVNPAVTISAWVWGAIPLKTAGLYIGSQFVGAIIGYAGLVMITPPEAFYPYGDYSVNATHAFCTTVPSPSLSSLRALLTEFMSTSILILLCCAVWDSRNAAKQDSVPIKFGLTITALALATGAYTGGSMNPARSFAPALITGTWDRQWVYWLAPTVAALLVTYLYKFLFLRVKAEPIQDQSEIPLNQTNTVKTQEAVEKGSTEVLPSV